jgi:hypothetical protein
MPIAQGLIWLAVLAAAVVIDAGLVLAWRRYQSRRPTAARQAASAPPAEQSEQAPAVAWYSASEPMASSPGPMPQTVIEPGYSTATSRELVITEPTLLTTTEVVPETGETHIRLSIQAPPGTRLRVTVETLIGPGGQVVQPAMADQPVVLAGVARPSWPAAAPAPAFKPRPLALPAPANPRLARLRYDLAAVIAGLRARDALLPLALFVLAAILYDVTRFTGLAQFPIYFFTDEAIQTVQAARFVANGLRDSADHYFPTYFENGAYHNLSVSVYAQIVPYLIFGKSIAVTRGVSAMLSLFGGVAASLILKNIFHARWWWLGLLLLAVTPAWFLHSRTAFEVVIMVALYAGYLYFYLLYRYFRPRYLLLSLLFGALAFYSYNGGQLTVVFTGLLLLITDWRYHWAKRKVAVLGLGLLGVLLLPYLRFVLQQPNEARRHLRLLDSYLLQTDLNPLEKLVQFVREYAYGLSPQFWFAADNGRDLVRHIMKGYGHLALFMLPFLVVGLLVCLRKLRESRYRLVLIALLAAPLGGALTSVGITRVLVTVVPAALLTALGMEAVASRFPRRWGMLGGVGVFVALSLFGVSMLRDSLANGAVWYGDYQLGGLQWGARQLFAQIIPERLVRDPRVIINVSPTWANGTDLLPQFFLTEEQQQRVDLEGAAYYLDELRTLPNNLLVVLPPEEYEQFIRSPKFANIRVEEILPYPDGRPGFYFIRMAYSEQAAALFAAERAELLRPVSESYVVDGQSVTITHPRFGAGQLKDMLDGDAFTLVNAPSINPVVLDFVFSEPRPLAGITLITGTMADFLLSVAVYPEGGGTPQMYGQQFVGLPSDPTLSLDFDQGPAQAARVRVEIRDNVSVEESVNIHVRELQFR